MALQIAKESKFGIEATYWKIMGIVEDWSINQRLVVSLYGWIDKDMRNNYPQDPIAIKNIELDLAIFTIDPGRTGIYDAIKLLPDWETAIDC